jgi:hypothetical protein
MLLIQKTMGNTIDWGDVAPIPSAVPVPRSQPAPSPVPSPGVSPVPSPEPAAKNKTSGSTNQATYTLWPGTGNTNNIPQKMAFSAPANSVFNGNSFLGIVQYANGGGPIQINDVFTIETNWNWNNKPPASTTNSANAGVQLRLNSNKNDQSDTFFFPIITYVNSNSAFRTGTDTPTVFTLQWSTGGSVQLMVADLLYAAQPFLSYVIDTNPNTSANPYGGFHAGRITPVHTAYEGQYSLASSDSGCVLLFNNGTPGTTTAFPASTANNNVYAVSGQQLLNNTSLWTDSSGDLSQSASLYPYPFASGATPAAAVTAVIGTNSIIAKAVNSADSTLINNITVKLRKRNTPVYTEYNFTGQLLAYTVTIGTVTVTQSLANGAFAPAFQALFPPTDFKIGTGNTTITLPWRYYANTGYFSTVTNPSPTQLKIWVKANESGNGNIDIYYYFDENLVPGFQVLTWPRNILFPTSSKPNIPTILTWVGVGVLFLVLIIAFIVLATRSKRSRKTAKVTAI